jgi:hypothetical protein
MAADKQKTPCSSKTRIHELRAFTDRLNLVVILMTEYENVKELWSEI